MQDAVKQFGLMPNMALSEEQYKAVATFLYNADLDQANWLETERSKYSFQPADSTDYLKIGQNLALSTKATLGKNLLTAIKEKGTANALSFCNERAIPLTDSMALELKASIKRVSDQNRNPDNVANEMELAYIKAAKEEIESTGKAKPITWEVNNTVTGYYPIMTNEMCLQCHGIPKEQIMQETLDRISALYPGDKATGYDVDQLRGIWVVAFEKE